MIILLWWRTETKISQFQSYLSKPQIQNQDTCKCLLMAVEMNSSWQVIYYKKLIIFSHQERYSMILSALVWKGNRGKYSKAWTSRQENGNIHNLFNNVRHVFFSVISSRKYMRQRQNLPSHREYPVINLVATRMWLSGKSGCFVRSMKSKPREPSS